MRSKCAFGRQIAQDWVATEYQASVVRHPGGSKPDPPGEHFPAGEVNLCEYSDITHRFGVFMEQQRDPRVATRKVTPDLPAIKGPESVQM